MKVEPRMSLVEQLEVIRLPETDGAVVCLGDLWVAQPVLLVHLRHFG